VKREQSRSMQIDIRDEVVIFAFFFEYTEELGDINIKRNAYVVCSVSRLCADMNKVNLYTDHSNARQILTVM
jgi:hypothetical protein